MNRTSGRRRFATEAEIRRFEKAIRDARESPSKAFLRSPAGCVWACAGIPRKIKRDLDEAYWRPYLDQQTEMLMTAARAIGRTDDPEMVLCGLRMAEEWRELSRAPLEVLADYDESELEMMRLHFSNWSVIVWGTVANVSGVSVEELLQAALVDRWRSAAEGGMLLKEMPDVSHLTHAPVIRAVPPR